MTATITENTHQPVVDGTAVRCADDGCRHAVFGIIRATEQDDPNAQERARESFKQRHTVQYEPGRAPDIEVDWQIVATCSVCPDGGDVDTNDGETVICKVCSTTWYIDGTGGERGEDAPEPPAPAPAPEPVKQDDRYTAARDADGGIRLNNGKGLLVANADHTRSEVLGWFYMSSPGDFREQYRAALRLMNREQGFDDAPPVHLDESPLPTT